MLATETVQAMMSANSSFTFFLFTSLNLIKLASSPTSSTNQTNVLCSPRALSFFKYNCAINF